MDAEVTTLITEIGEKARQWSDLGTKHDKRLSELESRLDMIATFGTGGSKAHDRTKLWMPSATELKAQAISSEPGGGYLVPEQNAELFFDRLRPSSVVLSAGPLRYQMKTDRELIPKLGSSVTVYNPGEGGTITDSTIQFATVALQARKYATRTIGSAEWFQDANPDARRIVQNDHERSLSAALDKDMLEGSGTGNTILGLRNVPGANETVLGSGSGAVVTLDDVLDAIGRLESNDAKASAIFMAPRTWAQLRGEKSVVNGTYHLNPDPSSETARRLFGVPVFVSSQISLTEAPGSGDSSYILVVDMSRVVVGTRLMVNVLFDPFSRSATDQVVINTTTRWALACMDADAVEIIGGCQPDS